MTKEAHNVSCYQQGRTAYAEYKDSLKGQVYSIRARVKDPDHLGENYPQCE